MFACDDLRPGGQEDTVEGSALQKIRPAVDDHASSVTGSEVAALTAHHPQLHALRSKITHIQRSTGTHTHTTSCQSVVIPRNAAATLDNFVMELIFEVFDRLYEYASELDKNDLLLAPPNFLAAG